MKPFFTQRSKDESCRQNFACLAMQTVPCPLPKLVPPKERCTHWLEVGLETIHNAGRENMELLDLCPTITFANEGSESLVSFIMIIIYNFEFNIFYQWSFCRWTRRSNDVFCYYVTRSSQGYPNYRQNCRKYNIMRVLKVQ